MPDRRNPCHRSHSNCGFPTRANPWFRNTQARKFRCGFGQFGVLVALIIGVSVAGMKIASRGRKGSFGSCYNRRRINDLGSQAASAKMGHYFHRHSQGNNVKSFVPESE